MPRKSPIPLAGVPWCRIRRGADRTAVVGMQPIGRCHRRLGQALTSQVPLLLPGALKTAFSALRWPIANDGVGSIRKIKTASVVASPGRLRIGLENSWTRPLE